MNNTKIFINCKYVNMIIGLLILLTQSQSFIFQSTHSQSLRQLYQKTFVHLSSPPIITSADLTPAIDKYINLPTNTHDVYTLTASGPAPTGPDPFNLVADDLEPLSEYVKELIVSENPVLTMAASHFFEKVSLNHLV